MSWAYEGIQCYVSPTLRPLYTPIYRAWNGSDHFYTDSKQEYDGLPAAYSREGIAFYAATVNLGHHVPLYRLYHAGGDDHFYTTSAAERDNAVSALGYTLEGTTGYVLSHAAPGHVELYRAYNPEIVDHFYTTDVAEIDNNGPTRSSDELEDILRRQLDGKFKNERLYFADGNYFCPTVAVAQDIIARARIDQRRYISEIHDCEDFAHLLKSAFIEDAYDGGRRSLPYALGIAWGEIPAHALNVLVTGDGKQFTVHFVEPQTGTIHPISDDLLKDIYLLMV